MDDIAKMPSGLVLNLNPPAAGAPATAKFPDYLASVNFRNGSIRVGCALPLDLATFLKAMAKVDELHKQWLAEQPEP